TLVNICPRLDAAAVCTSAVCPSRRIVPTMPSTVSGFTKQEAPCAGVVPAGSTRQSPALTARNWAYIAPPNRATLLPRSPYAAGQAPALTTAPAPSLPTGIGWSTRPTTAGISRGGIRAVTTGWSAGPATWTVLRSAGPKSKPRSDGLIGAASMRTTTSSAWGSGIGTSASDTSSRPSCVTVEYNCSAVPDCSCVMSRSPHGVVPHAAMQSRSRLDDDVSGPQSATIGLSEAGSALLWLIWNAMHLRPVTGPWWPSYTARSPACDE